MSKSPGKRHWLPLAALALTVALAASACSAGSSGHDNSSVDPEASSNTAPTNGTTSSNDPEAKETASSAPADTSVSNTAVPTIQLAPKETPESSVDPSAELSGVPSAAPTDKPSATPTNKPSGVPSAAPTARPSATPTNKPSGVSSAAPTARPSATPTNKPSGAEPTAAPSVAPTTSPTPGTSENPSPGSPTPKPSGEPESDGEIKVQDIIDKINADLKMRPMLEVDKKQIPDYYNGLDPDALIDEGKFQTAQFNISATEYSIVKLKSPDDFNTVKEAFEFRAKEVQRIFEHYLPDQYELALNYQIIRQGNYVLFSISDMQEDIANVFDGFFA